MSIICGNCKETHLTVEDVRECHGLFPQPEAPPPLEAPSSDSKSYPIPYKGTFTFVWGQDDSDYRTIRIKKWTSRRGCWLIELLTGPENSTDFTAFGTYDEATGSYTIWRRYIHNEKMKDVIEWLKASDEEKQKAAGEVYAMQSNNCWRCGHRLTVPASIHRGLGPDCAEKV